MVYDKLGSGMLYNGTWYAVGQRVIANDVSDYEGLVGTITEIREGEDKETENKTVDIYCDFEVPASPYETQRLEKRFSELYGCPKQVDDLSLDEIIMAPEMLVPLNEEIGPKESFIGYRVFEDWSMDGESGGERCLFLNYWSARLHFAMNLKKMQEEGCIQRWKDNKDLVVDSDENFYECYISGEFDKNHYAMFICKDTVKITDKITEKIGEAYVAYTRLEDFASFVDQWDGAEALSEELFKKFISDPRIPKRISQMLDNDTLFSELYWTSISNLAKEMMNEYLEQDAHFISLLPENKGEAGK